MQFPQLTQDQANHMFPGQRAMQDAILGLAAAGGNSDEIETVTSGNLSVLIPTSYLSVTGTQAYTLPNPPGSSVGLRKRIICSVAATTPAGTLTITTPENAATGLICSGTFYFDTVGQGLELYWTGTVWRAIRVDRAGGVANNVVVGTTVLTGFNMWQNYFLSVTGTVSSTTTKGIPNGSAVGEVIQVGVSTAASTPSGTITLTGVTTAGVTGTRTLGTAAATTNFAALRWDGTQWVQLGGSVLTLT